MPATRSGLRVGQLARLRESAYALLAQAYLYPHPARLGRLAHEARRLRRRDRTITSFGFAVPLRRLLDELASPALDGRALETAYVRAFVHAGPDAVCPPFESAYRGNGQGALLADLEREYGEAGLVVSPGATTAPDHAAVELEYMAFLCGREARRWEANASGEAALHARQLAFLDAHLGWWIPVLAERLVALATSSAYAALARASWAFVVHDRDLVGLLTDER